MNEVENSNPEPGYIFPSDEEVAEMRAAMPDWANEINDQQTDIATRSLMSALGMWQSES